MLAVSTLNGVRVLRARPLPNERRILSMTLERKDRIEVGLSRCAEFDGSTPPNTPSSVCLTDPASAAGSRPPSPPKANVCDAQTESTIEHGAGSFGDLRVHRNLLRPYAPALAPRPPISGSVRDECRSPPRPPRRGRIRQLQRLVRRRTVSTLLLHSSKRTVDCQSELNPSAACEGHPRSRFRPADHPSRSPSSATSGRSGALLPARIQAQGLDPSRNRARS